MATILNCFPLTVFKDKLGLEPGYRRQIGEAVIGAFRTGPKAGVTKTSAWTGDRNGGEFLHLEPDLAPMFKAVHSRMLEYLRALKIDPGKLDLHFTRSWGTVSEPGQSIRRHRHNQSHISVVYYPVKDPGTGNLVFHLPDPLNEFSPGLFEQHSRTMGLITESNILNSEMVDLPVEEDEVVIFPSKTYHGTEPNNTSGTRVSIAIDVVITLKQSGGVEYLMPPVENWRKSDAV
ncbi:MAG: putative 2OG-Fe(II) oxygenase [Thalassobaculaceae bacterium]